MTSFSVVSLIAMVPDREWRMPTLMVSWADAGAAKPAANVTARPAAAARVRPVLKPDWNPVLNIVNTPRSLV